MSWGLPCSRAISPSGIRRLPPGVRTTRIRPLRSYRRTVSRWNPKSFATDPTPAVAGDGYYRVSLGKGNQAGGGNRLAVLGNV